MYWFARAAVWLAYQRDCVMGARLSIRQCCLLSLVLTGVIGCGPSQDELFMRAAMRKRQPDVEETVAAPSNNAESVTSTSTTTPAAAAEPAVAPAPQSPPAAPVPPNAPAAAVVATAAANDRAANADLEDIDPALLGSQPEATESTPTVTTASGELVLKPMPTPITKRKPSSELSGEQKSLYAAEQMSAIGQAIKRYVREHGTVPYRNLKSANQRETLSWRVRLLPYLGYQELYDRFNLEEPWDGPNNRKLLPYIPDEFASPERYDWKTNWLGASATGYFLGGEELEYLSLDPLGDTIFCFEVNEEHALPWTQPGDYKLGNANIKSGLGALRPQGILTVWGDGNGGVVSSSGYWGELHAACTVEGRENQPASKIRREFRLTDELEDFDPTLLTANGTAAGTTAENGPGNAMLGSSQIATSAAPRSPVPSTDQVLEATQKFRKLYAAKIAAAKDDAGRTDLATEMLSTADAITDDDAGVFALLNAAANLASSAGKVEGMIAAIDHRVARFEVDGLQENRDAFLAFGAANMNRAPSEVDGRVYLGRAIPIIYGLCLDDEYVAASSILRYAIRFVDLPRTDPITKSLSTLRIHLANAQRQYDLVKDSLATYRDHPEDQNAAATTGQFLCLIKGNWEDGLKLLAANSDNQLGQLAAADLKGASDGTSMLTLADSWWELSRLAKSGTYRQASRDRAAYWYRQAIELLPNSLDLFHAKARLTEAEDAERSSPLALIQHLAELNGLQLETALREVQSGKREPLNVSADTE